MDAVLDKFEHLVLETQEVSDRHGTLLRYFSILVRFSFRLWVLDD